MTWHSPFCRVCGKNYKLEGRALCRRCLSTQQNIRQRETAEKRRFRAYCPKCKTYRIVSHEQFAGHVCKKCFCYDPEGNRQIRELKRIYVKILDLCDVNYQKLNWR